MKKHISHQFSRYEHTNEYEIQGEKVRLTKELNNLISPGVVIKLDHISSNDFHTRDYYSGTITTSEGETIIIRGLKGNTRTIPAILSVEKGKYEDWFKWSCL